MSVVRAFDPPRLGVGDHEVVEGHVRVVPTPLANTLEIICLCPSTILRMVPLPVSGRNA